MPLLALLLIAAQPDAEAQPVPGPIQISRAWTPAPEKPGGDTALYMTLANDGEVADSLVRARCAFADFTDRVTVDAGGEGSPSTRTVKAIPLPAHQTVTLKPDGYHIQLLHTTQPLQPGQIVGCTVTFQKSGERLVEVTVAPPGTQTPP
ncbi:MAG: copper chaperone PCu(A)C [Alphaproteobacteria bacterium]|nr:copper chaperone PCu(A)C [Alphaproteobacteria bacterium]